MKLKEKLGAATLAAAVAAPKPLKSKEIAGALLFAAEVAAPKPLKSNETAGAAGSEVLGAVENRFNFF